MTTVRASRNVSHCHAVKAHRDPNARDSLMHIRRQLPDPVNRPEEGVFNILQRRALYLQEDTQQKVPYL